MFIKQFLTTCFIIAGFTLDAKPRLIDFAYNVYSQFGEDGVINKIFELIEPQSKICIEFGAWDGLHLSNVAHLWKERNWRAILIESDRSRYDELQKNIQGYNCLALHEFVGKNARSLEAILKKNNLADISIDLLSIDIDGNDYYILESLEFIRPRVIICEYNPSFPAHLDIYPEYDNYMGCSVGALVRVAKNKGYTLIAITDTNCFFVKDEEFFKFSSLETELEKIKIDTYVTYVVSDYAGKYCFLGLRNGLPWGKVKSAIPRLQSNTQQIFMHS